MALPSWMDLQNWQGCSLSGQGFGVGPSAQLRALARMRATVVLPVPRTPENR